MVKPYFSIVYFNMEISGTNARTWKTTEPKLDTHGGGGGESGSCRKGVADWSGGGG